MNHVDLLMKEFGMADIPLEMVAEKYLGMSIAKARQYAAKGTLPFPVYRPGSQKSAWLVRVTDLSDWLEVERQKALNAQGVA